MNAHPRAGALVMTSTLGEVVRAFVPRPLPPDPFVYQRYLDVLDEGTTSPGQEDG